MLLIIHRLITYTCKYKTCMDYFIINILIFTIHYSIRFSFFQISKVWEQNFVWLFNETESKMKIRIIRRIIWRRALCFSSYKIKLKVKSKTVMSCCSQKKKEGIFCIVYFVRRKFLVSQCLV